ncbi:MAG: 4Fe-4S binding protein [Spirochaetales bacterium]|nr:4Fe-4S binding protein [Spirochaetales bacterium]
MITVSKIAGFLHLKKGEYHQFFASFLLCVLMALQLKTFVLGYAAGRYPLAGWIYALFLMTVFVLMAFSGKTSFYRRIFFVSFALLFFPSFIENLIEARGSMSLGAEEIARAEAPFCHIVIPITLIPAALARTVIFPARMSGHYAAVYSMLGIWLVASVMFGRGWCSWICFYGGWDEGFSRLARKRRINLDKADPRIRYFNYAMLMFIVLVSLAVFGSVYCQWFCPFKLITEYADVSNLKNYLAAIIFIVMFAGVVVVLPILTRKRVQCGLFCPFGAFQSLVSKISVYRVRRDLSKCSKCMACVNACPTLSVNRELIMSDKDIMSIRCTLCGECITACPQNALSYDYRTRMPEKLKAVIGRVREKLEGKPNAAAKVLLFLFNTAGELLRPVSLLPFAAFTFGVIISSIFAVNSIRLLLSVITGGAA